jgi:hypothetical protein
VESWKFRHLASGCTLTEIHFTFRIGISTASKIIQTVCCKIWDVLKNKYIPAPSKENWKTIAKGFEKTSNFPYFPKKQMILKKES